ncbi:MAG: transposase [Deltaproteobacteria bacterium]|nr:transposase [Deltaproteobacteria bacterium]
MTRIRIERRGSTSSDAESSPRHKEAQAQWSRYFRWYNEHRPHESLAGKTPNKVYRGVESANEAPRFEPRARCPSSAPCARPQAAPRPGPAPRRLDLHARFLDDERTLPAVELKQAA